MRIEGQSKIMANLRAAVLRAQIGAGNGMKASAEPIVDASQAIVPYDSGDLHDSAFVGAPYQSRTGPKVEFGYHGVPYAEDQHENLSYAHVNGGQAKFLEVPVMTMAPEALPVIAQHARAAMGA